MSMETRISEHPLLPDALKGLRELMSHLGNIENAARLRYLTYIGAVLHNDTKWTETFQMVRQFFQIEEYVRGATKVDNYLPTAAHLRSLENALTHFQNFESILKHLQTRRLMLGDARPILNTVCEDYPEMKNIFLLTL